jgi:hypothetical protein
MPWWRAAILHLVTLALFGSLAVATVPPLDLIALIAWAFVVRAWAARESDSDRERRWNVVWVIQVAGMCAVVLVAAYAPIKVVDQQKSRRITLPKQVMTLDELADPAEHGWNRFYYCSVSVPEGMADRAVQFPSRELRVGEFIAAVEAQTPLRHRFQHCGNGYTVLWGGDCSFGLHFRVPDGYKPPSNEATQRTRLSAGRWIPAVAGYPPDRRSDIFVRGGPMNIITPDQRRAAAEAGDAPIELADPQTGDSFILVRADVFRRMRELLEDREDRLEHEGWAASARRARGRWAAENPY